MSSRSTSSARAFRKRLLGFAGLPFLSLIAPFVLLPIIARVGGVEGWAAINVGQSVGAFASVFCGLGWSLVGPSKVASLDERGRRTLYRDGLVTRAVVAALVCPAAAAAGALLSAPRYGALAGLTAVALAISGLSPTWYSVGIGRPALIARYEILPRFISILLAAVLLLATGDLIVYPLCLILGTIGGICAYSVRVARILEVGFSGSVAALTRMFREGLAALTVAVAGAYSTTPVAIVSLSAEVKAVATFASADKLYRVALYSVQALGNVFQGWVAESTTESTSSARLLGRRMRISLLSHSVLGLVGGTLFALLGPLVSERLFGEAVVASPSVCVLYGVAFLSVSVNTSTGRHILVPLGRTGEVFMSTIIGAVLGVVAMFALAAVYGAVGGAAGFAASEVAVCVAQFVSIARLARMVRGTPAGLPAGVPA